MACVQEHIVESVDSTALTGLRLPMMEIATLMETLGERMEDGAEGYSVVAHYLPLAEKGRMQRLSTYSPERGKRIT